jgi:MarR family transcriptional regulator for hemolysin
MATPVPPREVLDLTGMLKHAGHVLETRLAESLAEIGLTPRLECVLVHAARDERTQVQLADLTHLDKTTMVATVDELEKQGWAERRPSPTDRRARVVALTPAGVRKAQEGQRIVDQVHAEVVKAIPGGEHLSPLLQMLLDGPLSDGVLPGSGIRRSRAK